jgi:hypothetical protein
MGSLMSARTGVLTSGGDGIRQGRRQGCRGTGLLVALLGMVAMAGCAKTVVDSQYESARWNLPRPSEIYVYDFAVTREHVHENAGFLQGTINAVEGQTTYEHEREIIEEVRTVAGDELVEGIQNLGLPARRVPGNTILPKGAMGITGQFLDVDEGNKGARCGSVRLRARDHTYEAAGVRYSCRQRIHARRHCHRSGRRCCRGRPDGRRCCGEHRRGCHQELSFSHGTDDES